MSPPISTRCNARCSALRRV